MNAHNIVKWVYARTTANSFGFDRDEDRLGWKREINDELMNKNPGLSNKDIGSKMFNYWERLSNEIKLTEKEQDFVSHNFTNISVVIENHDNYSPLRYGFTSDNEEHIFKNVNQMVKDVKE